MLNKQILQNGLNDAVTDVRLKSLKELMEKTEAEKGEKPRRGCDVNNHIHTVYSFSPYSPSKAVWMAYNAGLCMAGIMDHDSISGAEEFIAAGKIAGVATTIGVECRVSFSGTALAERTINNPDQASIAYVALHGIPHNRIDEVKRYFKPFTLYRNMRNKEMTEKLNSIFSAYGIKLDFENDVIPMSKMYEGGSITERHLLYALSLRLISHFGMGGRLLDFLKTNLSLEVSAKAEGYLMDPTNPYYAYDLLGILKSGLVEQFYVNATVECPDVDDFIAFSREIDAISAYPYLGDVEASVTGDKKKQKFEDSYLDLLFTVVKEKGFNAITYMPSRNSDRQLERIRGLCGSYGFFQISGEDINSPRQPFICENMRKEEFRNLSDSAWALIGHEAAAEKTGIGMFSPTAAANYPDLESRISLYREFGLQTFQSPGSDIKILMNRGNLDV